MKNDIKKSVLMFTVSAVLIIFPFALLIFVKSQLNVFYSRYAWLCFTFMVVCWIGSLVLLLKNYKRMVTIEMLEGMKDLIKSDREYFDYTGMQTNPYSYMIFLESGLIRDKYSIDRYAVIKDMDINLTATKKSKAALKRSLLRAVFCIEADDFERSDVMDCVTKMCEFLNTTDKEDYNADRRAVALIFIGRNITASAKTYTKKIRTIKNGAVVPVCVDLTESKIYFMCGKMTKQSNEELAQKLIVRYVLGDKLERIPRNDGSEPMSPVQARAIRDIDKIMEMNLRREHADKEKRKSDKAIFKSLQDGEIHLVEDVENLTLHYRKSDRLILHIYDIDSYEKKTLKSSDYNILQVYPAYDSIIGDEREEIIEILKNYVKSRGYDIEGDDEEEETEGGSYTTLDIGEMNSMLHVKAKDDNFLINKIQM